MKSKRGHTAREILPSHLVGEEGKVPLERRQRNLDLVSKTIVILVMDLVGNVAHQAPQKRHVMRKGKLLMSRIQVGVRTQGG